MPTREKILEAVLRSQPAATAMPDTTGFQGHDDKLVDRFMNVFKTIGGQAYLVDGMEEIKSLITKNFDLARRVVTTLPELAPSFELVNDSADPHSYEDVELAIIRAQFCVAENGASWFTDNLMGQRILPYICQHLAAIVSENDIVATLHEAYEIIGAGDYGFGAFIGGPSKTADIEQALVLGAHGPLSMTIFITKLHP